MIFLLWCFLPLLFLNCVRLQLSSRKCSLQTCIPYELGGERVVTKMGRAATEQCTKMHFADTLFRGHGKSIGFQNQDLLKY